jgi:SHS2 domain-containing protein
MPKYRFIEDLTSDVMFEAFGKDLKELFRNAAEALLSVICDIRRVKPEKSLLVEVKGRDAKDLLLNWLQELISRVDTDEMFFSGFEILEMDGRRLKARVRGESVSPGKSGTLVKGVTYYNFSLEKTKKGWRARVACDI